MIAAVYHVAPPYAALTEAEKKSNRIMTREQQSAA